MAAAVFFVASWIFLAHWLCRVGVMISFNVGGVLSVSLGLLKVIVSLSSVVLLCWVTDRPVSSRWKTKRVSQRYEFGDHTAKGGLYPALL